MRNSAWRWAGIALGAILLATTPGPAQAPAGLAALSRLQPGLWNLRDLDGGSGVRSICVADPTVFIQLEHRGLPCSRLIVDNDTNSATVHYTCPAGGYGRTEIKAETSRLAVIDTQGIARNRPFAYRFEARRAGACPNR